MSNNFGRRVKLIVLNRSSRQQRNGSEFGVYLNRVKCDFGSFVDVLMRTNPVTCDIN